jgi:putative membrane protein
MHDMDGMGWWMVWGAFMMVFFWGGLIALVVWAVKSFTGSGETATNADSGSGSPPALLVVEERYARGEITREEFLRIKGDLTGA